MQPSDQLVAAADLIRDLAAHACKGPWFAPGPDDTEERIWAHNGHGPRGYTVVESCDYDDGRWIAALSPALAEPLEIMFREYARCADELAYGVDKTPDGQAMLRLARVLLEKATP